MNIKELYETIDFEISLERESKERRIEPKTKLNWEINKSSGKWTEDYTEGYLDGLFRAKELIDEKYPSIPTADPLECEYLDCKNQATHYSGDSRVCEEHV